MAIISINTFENSNTEQPYRLAGINVQELMEFACNQEKDQEGRLSLDYFLPRATEHQQCH